MNDMEFVDFCGYWVLLPLPEREEWEKVRAFFDWKIAEEEAAWLHEHGRSEEAQTMLNAPDFFALRDAADLAKVEEKLGIAPELRKATR